MGYDKAITVDITGDLAEHVALTVGEYGYYETATEYVRDLIRRDIEAESRRFEAVRAELQTAFAEPESAMVEMDAEAFLAYAKSKQV